MAAEVRLQEPDAGRICRMGMRHLPDRAGLRDVKSGYPLPETGTKMRLVRRFLSVGRGTEGFQAGVRQQIRAGRADAAFGLLHLLISLDRSVVYAVLLVNAAETEPYFGVRLGKICHR